MDEPLSFGAWLKRRRKELDLTQQALADLVGCSVVSIRKFEQETQRPSRALAARLAEQIQIAPDEQQDFITFARFGTDVRSATLRPHRMALPAPWRATVSADTNQPRWLVPQTTLVGRAEERLAIATALLRSDVRLLTITGPGGVGKTRLAVAVATDLSAMGAFVDGVWSINLAPIRDPSLVAPTIAHALGVAQTRTTSVLTSLCAFLHDKQMLLLLDNFEQVLDAAPLLMELHAAAPECAFLVTSRARLVVSGETEVAVQPLAVPDTGPDTTVAAVEQSPAVQLFVARAQTVQPGFTLTDTSAPAIAIICQRLDGVPLAIELAAARSNLLSPTLLLERLEQRLPLLTGGARDLPQRHQTLRSTIAWGYDLLEPAVQKLFRRLAIFAGGWTLEAAEAVCAPSRERGEDIVQGLATLLDHHLMRQNTGPEPTARFSMLETIHEFAAEQLEISGETASVRADHAAYFLSLAERAEQAEGGKHLAWFDRLEQEHANLRAALEHGSLELIAQLSATLADFWALRDHQQEGERWLVGVLQNDAALPPFVQARVRAALAGVLYRRGDRMRERSCTDLVRVQCLLEESLALYRPSDDQRTVIDARIRLGEVLTAQGLTEQAQVHLETSLALAERERVPRLRAWARLGMALVATHQGEFFRAGELAADVLTVFRALSETYGCAWALMVLAHVALMAGNLPLAHQHHLERLVYERALGHREGTALTLMDLADVAFQQGNMDEAAGGYRESLHLWRELGARDRMIEVVERIADVAFAQGQHERAAQLRRAALAVRTVFTDDMHDDHQRYAGAPRLEGSEQALLEQLLAEAMQVIN